MVDDHMDHMDGAWHGMDSKHCSLSLSSQPTGHDAEACTTPPPFCVLKENKKENDN